MESKRKKVLIIGAGNIGSRHLQALKKVRLPLGIFVVDPKNESLETARLRYDQVGRSKFEKSCIFLNDLDNLPSDIDLAIIATNSKIRKDVTKTLLSKSAVRFILFEKLLFQKKGDYFEIEELLKKRNITSWVNCSMRTMPAYFLRKADIKKDDKVSLTVSGSQFGLITNSIHYIDYLSFLTDCDDFKIGTDLLDKKPFESKRKGFLELNGVLNIFFKNGSQGNFVCFGEGDAPIIVELINSEFRLFSNETERKAWIAKSPGWQPKLIKDGLLFQSEMTTQVTTDILTKGKCNLTSFEKSSKLHLQFLDVLLKFLNTHSLKKYDSYPFT